MRPPSQLLPAPYRKPRTSGYFMYINISSMHKAAISTPLARKVCGFSCLLSAQAEQGTIQHASPENTSDWLGKAAGACCTPRCPCHVSMRGGSNSALLLPDEVTKTEMFRGLRFQSDLIQDAFSLKEEEKKINI